MGGWGGRIEQLCQMNFITSSSRGVQEEDRNNNNKKKTTYP